MAPKGTDQSNDQFEDKRKRLTDKELELSPEQQKEVLKGKDQMPDDPVSSRDQEFDK